jgi:7-carboxy-7-deazaguanine synthase
MGAPTKRASVKGQVAEVFRSFQGEGMALGQRQVFVRLAGCEIGCRYCDTEWAFRTPADVAVPGRDGERRPNPFGVEQLIARVDAADPPRPGRPLCPVSLTGGEPLEQVDFAEALVTALRPRDVMLETAGLHAAALARLAPLVRWVSCDLKLPSATGRDTALDEHAAVFESGALEHANEVCFKLIVDGDTPLDEVDQACQLVRRHAPESVIYLQPVTPLGGSPALPRDSLDPLVDLAQAQALEVRVIPQVHKVLRVR